MVKSNWQKNSIWRCLGMGIVLILELAARCWNTSQSISCKTVKKVVVVSTEIFSSISGLFNSNWGWLFGLVKINQVSYAWLITSIKHNVLDNWLLETIDTPTLALENFKNQPLIQRLHVKNQRISVLEEAPATRVLTVPKHSSIVGIFISRLPRWEIVWSWVKQFWGRKWCWHLVAYWF